MANSEFLINGQQIDTKFKLGKYLYPFSFRRIDDRIWFQFGFNKDLSNLLKEELSDIKWHGYEDPPTKMWSAKYCRHNIFRLKYHTGLNPYATYDKPIDLSLESERPLKPYQIEMRNHLLFRKKCHIAGDPGIGKTLAAIEAMEMSKIDEWLWVGPEAGIYAVQLELRKWGSKIKPKFSTYSSLKKLVETWPKGKKVYQGMVFDEGHNLKSLLAQKTQSATYLSESLYEDWDDDSHLYIMTGTPAPKSPVDWYSQCEIACPGFLREGSIHKFKSRVGLVAEGNNNGVTFPQLITWYDDENKCKKCGLPENDLIHGMGHPFVKSVNEVAKLYSRMKGLVLVKRKKECTGLPDKIYRQIKCEVPKEVERAANLILKTSTSTIKALSKLRELSDGFQYTKTVDGQITCPLCLGHKQIESDEYIGPEISIEGAEEKCTKLGLFIQNGNIPYEALFPIEHYKNYYEKQNITCTHCGGNGLVDNIVRSYKEVACPKDKVLVDLLEEYSEYSRTVIFAGFTASIDRCVKIVKSQEWDYIRVDGSGWSSSVPELESPVDMLEYFQSKKGKMAFIGHPGSAGVGITLTASPVAIFFSNDFNAVSRLQAIDRIHRPGMDENVGATIIDLINLATDLLIIENLDKKEDLQNLSLGQIADAI